MAANPFVLPPEEEVFRMRESEKTRKAEERERLKHMSVAEKTTFCSRSSAKGQRSIAEDRRARPPQVPLALPAAKGAAAPDINDVCSVLHGDLCALPG